jgi:hypothetical protein
MTLIVLATLSAGASWATSQIRGLFRDAGEADLRLHAVKATCNLVLDYVEQKRNWPRSWDDLRSLKRWRYGDDPAAWSPALWELVEVNFAVPLEEVREDSPATFHAIRPVRGRFQYSCDAEYSDFLAKLRTIVPRE